MYLAVLVILLRKYRRTRDIGLVWLGVALLVCPSLSGLLEIGQHFLIGRFTPGGFMGRQITLSNLITYSSLLRQMAAIALLLVAVSYLYNSKNKQRLSA